MKVKIAYEFIADIPDFPCDNEEKASEVVDLITDYAYTGMLDAGYKINSDLATIAWVDETENDFEKDLIIDEC